MHTNLNSHWTWTFSTLPFPSFSMLAARTTDASTSVSRQPRTHSSNHSPPGWHVSVPLPLRVATQSGERSSCGGQSQPTHFIRKIWVAQTPLKTSLGPSSKNQVAHVGVGEGVFRFNFVELVLAWVRGYSVSISLHWCRRR